MEGHLIQAVAGLLSGLGVLLGGVAAIIREIKKPLPLAGGKDKDQN